MIDGGPLGTATPETVTFTGTLAGGALAGVWLARDPDGRVAASGTFRALAAAP